MQINNLRVPFGQRKGQVVAPADVPRGLACGCNCPSCGTSLIAKRMSKSGLFFFAHHNAPDCPKGFETALHLMAKQVIQEASVVALPEKEILISAHYQEVTKQGTIVFPSRCVSLNHIIQEKRIERWVPDISAELVDKKPLFIEIRVTHEVEDAKAQALDNVMEIDLRALHKVAVLDISTVRNAVLHTAPRKWHRCSLYDQSPEIQKKKDELINEAKNDIAARQLKRSFTNHKEQKRSAWDKELRQLVQMQTQEGIDSRELALLSDERYVKATEWIACKLGENPKANAAIKAMPVWNIPLKNDWIFNAHRLVWQAKLVFGLIFNKAIGQTITVHEALGYIEQNYPIEPVVKSLDEMKRRYKNQGKARKKWYGEEGAWFLDHKENKAIISPYRVVIQYLDYLSNSDSKIINKHTEKPIYFVNGNSIPYLINRHEEQLLVSQRLRQARYEAEVRAEEAQARQAELRIQAREQRAEAAKYCSMQLTTYVENGATAISFCRHCRAAYDYIVEPNTCLKCGYPAIHAINSDEIDMATLYHRIRCLS
ncbi:hypothetical protein [Halomonas sp. 3D7M]|uniref:hypothetical protein n=1 Tax=Halomonas sp. 3D7M TaxID=2742617 RepID=UPI0018688B04|nr:hypothetical protein [Halomonas sp. 3D7M]